MLATSGDTNLGGEDFDQQIMAHFVKQITKERHIDISKDARALQKLRKEAERARRELSSKSSAMLEVDAILKGDDFQDAITRAKFEQLCADPFKEAAAWRGNNMWRLRAIGGGSGKGGTPLRRWPPDLHPPKAPRKSAATACGGTVRRQCAATACGDIAWRQHVAAACDRWRGVGKGGRR